MKTIEERAWEKYPKVIKHHNLAQIDINEEKRKMYIEIATEQKAIDNDRAKEAFNKACGWLSTYSWFNEVFEEFIKALEE